VRQADQVLAGNDVEIRSDNWQELAVERFAPSEPERTALTQVIAYYDWALARYPRCAVFELWIADAVFRDAGDFWRARQMYRYTAEHLPDHFKSYQELGFLSYLVGDFPGALAWYEQAVERVGNEHQEMGARILYNRGLLRYIVDGDRAAAIADVQEALRRYPDYGEAKRTLRSLRRKKMRWVPW
jgi:tetratricopeptide (TPR) repeat protein